MQAILDFLGSIGGAIVAAFDFLVSLIMDLVYLVQITGKMLAQIPLYFSWMPPAISAIVITAVTIAVLYKILGRD